MSAALSSVPIDELLEVRLCRVPGCPNEATGPARGRFANLCRHHREQASEAARIQAIARARALAEIPLVAPQVRELADAAKHLDRANRAVRDAQRKQAAARDEFRRLFIDVGRRAGLLRAGPQPPTALLSDS